MNMSGVSTKRLNKRQHTPRPTSLIPEHTQPMPLLPILLYLHHETSRLSVYHTESFLERPRHNMCWRRWLHTALSLPLGRPIMLLSHPRQTHLFEPPRAQSYLIKRSFMWVRTHLTHPTSRISRSFLYAFSVAAFSGPAAEDTFAAEAAGLKIGEAHSRLLRNQQPRRLFDLQGTRLQERGCLS
jgi:hypothetical protein